MTMMTMPEPGRIPEFSTADRMRKARESAGISQDEMADSIGVSRRSVVRYEGGASVPKSAMLLWSMRTGVPRAWLETGIAPESGDGPEGDGGAVVRSKGLEPPTFCSVADDDAETLAEVVQMFPAPAPELELEVA